VDYVYAIELPPQRLSADEADEAAVLRGFIPRTSELRAVCEETWLGIRQVALQVIQDR
jgi:hypothetical protein